MVVSTHAATTRRIGSAGIVVALGTPDEAEPLSPHQIRVLGLLALGLRDDEIAARIGTTKRNASNAIARMYAKLGVRNRVEATHVALRLGLVRVEG